MRVSSSQVYDNFSYFNRLRSAQLQQNTAKMSSQRRYTDIGEAPLPSARSSYRQSKIQRYQKYQQQVGHALGRYRLSESRLAQVIENVQTIRELSVSAANSTKTPADLALIARVADELIEDTLMLANSRDEQGLALFAGNAVRNDAFAVGRSYSADFGREVLAQVWYNGDGEQRSLEVEDGVYLPVQFNGNRVFWAAQDEWIGGLPIDNYRALTEGRFFIDGQTVQVEVGDSAASIIRKMNESGVAVKASQDPVTQVLMLQSTVPHQIQLHQEEGSAVLQELGLLAQGASRLTEGRHPDALNADGSLFSILIGLRDDMLSGDVDAIGGSHLAEIDQALAVLTTVRTDLGARQQRLQQQQSYNQQALLDYQSLEAGENDLDAAEAASELQRLMTTQQAIYQSLLRLSQLNLMSFLRP